MTVGAVASSGGADFSGSWIELISPRPGEAHRTFYRVNSRSDVDGADLGEPFSLGQPSFHFASRGRYLRGATADAPLTGEATSGGQTCEARMTVPRPFGELCLAATSIATTSTLPDLFPHKQHGCDYIHVFL